MRSVVFSLALVFQGALLFAQTATEFRLEAKALFEQGCSGAAFEKIDQSVDLDRREPLNYFWRALIRPDMDGKIKDLSRALHLDKEFVEAYFERGLVFFSEQEYVYAAADFSEVLKRKAWGKAYYWRGLSYFFVGEHARAIADFNHAETLRVFDVNLYWRRAECYQKTGQLEAAINDFVQVVNLEEAHFQAYLDLAFLYRKLKRWGEALWALNQAEQFAAAHEEQLFYIYNQRGQVKLALGDWFGAKNDFLLALRHNPNSTDAQAFLGRIYQQQGQLDKSIQYYTQALKVNDRLYEVYLWRSQAAFDRMDYRLAKQDLFSAIEINPDLGEGHYLLAKIFHAEKVWDKAIYHYRQAISLGDSSLAAVYGLAQCYLEQQQFALALPWLDATLNLKTDFIDAYFSRATAYKALQKYELAKKDYQRVIERDSQKTAAYYNLGNILYEQGLFQEALTYYNFVIEQSPQWDKAYYNRSLVKEALGDVSGAEDDLRLSQLFA